MCSLNKHLGSSKLPKELWNHSFFKGALSKSVFMMVMDLYVILYKVRLLWNNWDASRKQTLSLPFISPLNIHFNVRWWGKTFLYPSIFPNILVIIISFIINLTLYQRSQSDVKLSRDAVSRVCFANLSTGDGTHVKYIRRSDCINKTLKPLSSYYSNKGILVSERGLIKVYRDIFRKVYEPRVSSGISYGVFRMAVLDLFS